MIGRSLGNKELENEYEVDPLSDELYQMITEEGAWKQFDSEELDNEVDPRSDELDPTITEEEIRKQFDPEESDNEE